MREYIIPYTDDITPEMVRALYKEERELIRCRDCIHGMKTTYNKAKIVCEYTDAVNPDDWYCADGIRKDE